jgi:hypothetical protein
MTKNKFHQILLFLFSPFLSLPITVYGIHKKSTLSLILFVLTIGLMSYSYTPSITDDKASYYDLFAHFKNLSWPDFCLFAITGSDYFLYFYLLLMGKVGVSFQISVSLITITSVSIIFYIFNKSAKLGNDQYFLSFLIILFTIPPLALFSGIRNYLASAVVIYAFYCDIGGQSKIKSFFLLLFAALVHYSAILFIFVYLLFLFLKNKPNLSRLFFILSLSFFLIPRSFIFDLLNNVSIEGAIILKLNGYLGSNDVIEGSMIENANVKYIYWGSMLWLLFAYSYLFHTSKQQTCFKELLCANVFFINLFFQTPTVFERYLMVLQSLFALFFIYEYIQTKKISLLYTLVILFSIRFIFHLIIMRNNIIESYFNSDVFLFVTVLLKKITEENFLR